MQIAKDIGDIILKGAQGTDTQEKICDDHEQGEVLCKDHAKKKVFTDVYARLTHRP